MFSIIEKVWGLLPSGPVVLGGFMVVGSHEFVVLPKASPRLNPASAVMRPRLPYSKFGCSNGEVSQISPTDNENMLISMSLPR